MNLNPLAQTFVVDMKGGMFATSIGLYFGAKDDSLPVTVHLRTTENGIPTNRIIPFSEVTVLASAVLVSEDSSLPTNFTFESPVYLQQGTEYAFVVTSGSDKYRLFVSEMGGQDLYTPSFTIVKQPNAGVMYKTSNGTTWTPDQTKDIKFVLRRAAFAQSRSVVFSDSTIPPVLLESNPLYTENASNSVRVYHQNHGHFAGVSQVTISGAAALSNIPATDINKTHTVYTVEQDWYTIQVATTANSTVRGGGSLVYATENRPFDVFQPLVTNLAIPDTSANWSARLTTGTSLAGTETPHVVEDYSAIQINENNYLKRPHTIVSSPNRSLLSSGDRSFILKGEFQTDRNNLSPVVDLDRLSVATVANRIDNPAGSASPGKNAVKNYVDETAARATSALSKYITKKIDLNDPASAIKIYLSVNRPSGSDLTLYYKILQKGSDAVFDDIGWTLADPDSAIPVSDNLQDYNEVQYNIDEFDLGGVLQSGVITGNKEFSAFAIKLTFTSQNSSNVATVRDFRAIAIS